MDFPDYTGPRDDNFHQMLGYEMVAWDEKHVRFEMDVQDRHRNSRDSYTHGGILMGLLDIACLYAGVHGRAGAVDSVTISLNTNFIAALYSERLAAEGELVRLGRSIYFAQSRVIDIATGTLLATAQGTFKVRAKKT
jgi:uncharacterized protein (TIGR00369 family)